jgi:hypothetical protein
MKLLILYHPQSDHVRKVIEYEHEFHVRQPGSKIELVSLETKEGADFAKLYDVVRYPALLAIAGDGSLQKLWLDDSFPLINELEYYTQNYPTSGQEYNLPYKT